MKKDEKKPLSWEVADPKPPVIESGHMENRKQNQSVMETPNRQNTVFY